MGMEHQIQFQDFSNCVFSSQSLNKLSFDQELDMILGISPLPMGMQEEPEDNLIGQNLIARKNSLISESLQTHHNEVRSEQNFIEQSSNNVKKSNHHNFQKHTVTSLKDLVREENFQKFIEETQYISITRRLWREILLIKGKSIMTKKFLSILFRDDLQSVQLLKLYGFKQMFLEFNQRQILAAKNQLRKIVIKSLNDKSVAEHVAKREIKRKEQFKLYLLNFRHELQNANIKKRISKQSSDWIASNAEIFDCLN